jgi:bifunctional non-homologous end joining protein LigD
MRVHKRRDLVIAGYTPGGRKFDAILVGYYEGRTLMFVGKVRAGFTPALRASVSRNSTGSKPIDAPFKNLSESRHGQWGEGLTAAEMEKCRWLNPRLVASIEYLERTGANHLRHAKYSGLRER